MRVCINRRSAVRACAALLAPVAIAAQQRTIPTRDLSAIEARSAEPLRELAGVRELPGGRLIVNDAGAQRLLLLDASLRTEHTLADNNGTGSFAYGARATRIFPFSGDSTVFVDQIGRALVLLNPQGKVARVMSPPRPGDLGHLAVSTMGVPFVSGGYLIYRSTLRPQYALPVKGKAYETPSVPDSSPILRVNRSTRRADTLRWIRTPGVKPTVTSLANGGVVLRQVVNPLQVIDDWAMLSDGTLAVVRGADYRVEWMAADGTRGVGEKLLFAWRQITEEMKVAMIDSTRNALLREVAQRSAAAPASNGGAGHGSASGASSGSHSMTIMPLGEDDTSPAVREAAARATSGAAEVVESKDLPDYYPSLQRSGMVMADREARLWVLPATVAGAQLGDGLVYDVVSNRGVLLFRARLPKGRALQGFGENGAVYLAAFEGGKAWLERSRLP